MGYVPPTPHLYIYSFIVYEGGHRVRHESETQRRIKGGGGWRSYESLAEWTRDKRTRLRHRAMAEWEPQLAQPIVMVIGQSRQFVHSSDSG